MNRITYEDRKVLEKLLKTSISKRGIGRAMGFSHSVILYEIKHHSSVHIGYEADRAQGIYERKHLNKGNLKKLVKNVKLREFVLEKLKQDHSPEQIAGRLKNVLEEREKVGSNISHETIYKYIYDSENKKEKYWQYLMRHRKKRIKSNTRRYRYKSTIKNMTSISKRPKYIEKRDEAGYWESDSMIFSKQKEILSVQVERKTRYTTLSKCQNKTAKETYHAITSQLADKDIDFLKTITLDRGTEGAKHEEITKYLGVKVYFCHPYSSWEKGSVENRNMFIRRYLPRNTIMSKISHENIYTIQEKLNNRPMKCLNYRTPNEMMFYEKFNRYPPPNSLFQSGLITT